MNLHNRLATLADAEMLRDLGEYTFLDTYAVHNTPENMADYLAKHFTLARIQQEINDANVWFLLLEEDNQLIAYSKLIISKLPTEIEGEKGIEIERIYARKEAHGKGIGKRLMEECMIFAKAQGYNILWLGVWEHNHKAIGFYEKMGFEKFGSHIFLLGDDVQNDYLMKKSL